MDPWLGVPGNPASVHRAGQAAAMAVDRAREQVAALVGAEASGVIFTSGATEANHTFLRGVESGGRVVVSPIEHPSVHGACAMLADRGHAIEHLRVGADGVVLLPDALPADTTLVSLMMANHETGVIQPVQTAAALARARGAKLHVDATQAAGRLPIDVDADGIVLSAHKMGGPGGIGALVLRDGQPYPALLTGGSQERGRRAGTVHTAAAVGFGAACALASSDLEERTARMRALSQRVHDAVRALGGRIVGATAARVPNTTCCVFPGILGETLVQALDLRGVCVSSGAACASGSLEPSPVLLAMGHPQPDGALRISVGPTTEADEVQRGLRVLADVVATLRGSDDQIPIGP